MRAWMCRKFGDLGELTLEQVSDPICGPGQVRIQIGAAGVNFADTLMVLGKYQASPPPPFSPGLEAAGEIIEIGAGVTGLALGDRVVAILNGGGYAEQAVVEATRVVLIPDAMPFSIAAGFVVAYGTAHFGLLHRAHVQPGETLLITGAAGGVGLTAVEIGKALGARVIAAANGAEKCRLAADYGADVTIDYGREDLRQAVKQATGGSGVDVFYDPVGGEIFDSGFRALARGGRLLIIGFASGTVPQLPANILLVKNITAIGYYWGAYFEAGHPGITESIGQLIALFEKGALRPPVTRCYPLEQAVLALKDLAARRSTGKIVLTMDEG